MKKEVFVERTAPVIMETTDIPKRENHKGFPSIAGWYLRTASHAPFGQ
jgi:hypothetical protein